MLTQKDQFLFAMSCLENCGIKRGLHFFEKYVYRITPFWRFISIPQIIFFGVCLLPPFYEIIEPGGIKFLVESVSCIQETLFMILFDPFRCVYIYTKGPISVHYELFGKLWM